MKTKMRERFNKHFVFKLVNTMEDRVWGTEDQRENLLSFFESELKGLREEVEGMRKDVEYKPVYDEWGNEIVLRGHVEDAIAHRWYVTGSNKRIDDVLKLIDERMGK